MVPFKAPEVLEFVESWVPEEELLNRFPKENSPFRLPVSEELDEEEEEEDGCSEV